MVLLLHSGRCYEAGVCAILSPLTVLFLMVSFFCHRKPWTIGHGFGQISFHTHICLLSSKSLFRVVISTAYEHCGGHKFLSAAKNSGWYLVSGRYHPTSYGSCVCLSVLPVRDIPSPLQHTLYKAKQALDACLMPWLHCTYVQYM